MKNMQGRILVGVAALALCVLVPRVQAFTFGFKNISHNGPNDIADQLSVDVESPVAGQVQFTFRNASGGLGSSISEIYFDDGTLLGIASIVDQPPDVDFVAGATPKQLPGGSALTPKWDTTYSVSLAKKTSEGVNPGESVGIVFDLINGQTLADTIEALMNGELRLGLHVSGIEGNGANDSDSFITKVADGGATALLLGFVLLGVEGIRRKIKR